jgi:hypothetical protein
LICESCQSTTIAPTSRSVADSRQKRAHDLAVDVRQPESAAMMEVRQALVIDAQQVQRRVEIVDVHGALGHL